MNNTEQEFYSRQILLPQVGEKGQEKLKQAKVLVIGAGGLGCPILQYLNAVGVGTIGVADADTISISNLHRQVLYGVEDVGKLKVEVAKQKLELQNPHTNIEVYQEFLTKENAISLVEKYDIIVDGSDNFTTKYLVNDACILANKPLVFGSISQFEGQVSVFNYKNGATYRCIFPEIPNPEDTPNCSESGVLGILPSVIGSLQANEVIKLILEIGKPLAGKLLIWNALSGQQQILNINKNEKIQVSELKEEVFHCETETKLMNRITIQEYNENKDNYHLLDVRSKMEYMLRNIKGYHIPLQKIGKRAEEIKDWDKPIVVHCASGMRSAQAIKILKEKYPEKEFYNLEKW